MILSPSQIALTRDHTLQNLLGFSTACIDAGERMSELLTTAGREAVANGARRADALGNGQATPLSGISLTPWVEIAQASQYLDRLYEIVGDTHKAAIVATKAHFRTFDQAILAAIEQARKNSPWEGEIALNAMRTTLESAEQGLEGLTDAAIQAVDLVEQEVHQASEAVTEGGKKSGLRGKKT